MLWLLTDTVNDYPQFRTHFSSNGPGIFDEMLPSYTIFNKSKETFSSIWTEFSPDYGKFLQHYIADVKTYGNAASFSPKPGKPKNCYDDSMVGYSRCSRKDVMSISTLTEYVQTTSLMKCR